MLPSRLARAFGRLDDTIARTGVMAALAPLRLHSAGPRPDVHSLLEAFAAISTAQQQFGEPERALLRAVNLESLVDTAWWARVITATARSTIPDDLASELLAMCIRLDFVAGGFTALAGLLSTSETVTDAEPHGLVLTLSGPSGAPPSIGRISSAMAAVSQLWTVAEELTGQPGALQLLATEPGLTTSLTFDGPDDPLLELRGLLVSVWEQVVRLPGATTDQLASLVPEMLPVMERIGQAGRSDVQRIRHMLDTGVRHLLEAQCSLRGMALPEPPARRDRPLFRRAHPAGPIASAAALPPVGVAPAPSPAPAVADMGHLADVIAEERRQLHEAQVPRRL